MTFISFLRTLPTILTSKFLLCNYKLQLASRHMVLYWSWGFFFFFYLKALTFFFPPQPDCNFLDSRYSFVSIYITHVPSAAWKLYILKIKINWIIGKFSFGDIWVYCLSSDTHCVTMGRPCNLNPSLSMFHLSLKPASTQTLLKTVWVQWILIFLCHGPSWASDERRGYKNVIHIYV